MEFVDGGNDAAALIEKDKDGSGSHISGETVVSWIRQAAEGLAHLHNKGIIHGDFKLENVLVAPDGRLRISDLGSARLIADDTNDTVLAFTRSWAHPELRGMGTTSSRADPNRFQATVPRSLLRYAFDLFALGRNIFRVLEHFDPADESLLSPYLRSYLELAAARLLDGRLDDSECALGLPRSALSELKYETIDEFLFDIKKLTGEVLIERSIPDIDRHYPRTIQIAEPGPTPFSNALSAMMAEPLVHRLGNVTQLGLISQIYPTATHSRLEHVLGTFANTVRYVDALWNDPVNPMFKQIMNEEDIRVLLVAALCHDIGHYPLAHDLEEVSKDLFDHEPIMLKFLKGKDNSANVLTLRETIKVSWQVDPQHIIQLFEAKPTNLNHPIKLRILHSILDGPIDADKVSYLVRDSVSLGLPYGRGIDLQRFLNCLTVTFRTEAGQLFAAIGIYEKGKFPAESIAFTRYALFGTVYWHHTSRAAKSMLHMAGWLAIKDLTSTQAQARFKRELANLVINGQQGMERQLELGQATDTGGRPEDSSYLHPNDSFMLQWISDRTQPVGKALLEMVRSRTLFKRLLVISKSKNQELWANMARVGREFSPRNRISFQEEVQRRLVRLIDQVPHEKRTTSALDPSLTDDLVSRSDRGEVLFLIDIPTSRPGSGMDLYFLPEQQTNVSPSTRLQSENANMKNSVMWDTIIESFLESVGKVRVFVHPEFEKTAAAALPRIEVESALAATYRQLRDG